jgi:hypothetical protein
MSCVHILNCSGIPAPKNIRAKGLVGNFVSIRSIETPVRSVDVVSVRWKNIPNGRESARAAMTATKIANSA